MGGANPVGTITEPLIVTSVTGLKLILIPCASKPGVICTGAACVASLVPGKNVGA
jgi:hypothetical protein